MQRSHSARSINETDSERQIIGTSQGAKPLPPLPRGWSRICHETGIFLRGVGLGIVVTAFQGFFTKNFSEPEKVAIRRSRTTALLITLIHVVPVGVATYEIILNFKGHYVGRDFDNQSYLQFAAKAHEITMQASIATVLLSYIRYQIGAGKGMPFGAVLGGLQFIQVGYLWSVEFWSSILSKDFQLRRKACFVALILICITIVATAGPSSASLLIARQGVWPTASRYLAVNASFLDIWPDRLNDEKIERDCAMVRFDSLEDAPHCPLSTIYVFLTSPGNKFIVDAPTGAVSEVGIPNAGNSAATAFYRYLCSSLCDTSLKDQYCASFPHLEPLYGYHLLENHLGLGKDGDGYQFIQDNYYQPYTIASCVADVKDASDQTPLKFARISETESQLKKEREIISIPGLTIGQIIQNVSSYIPNSRISWVDLPMDDFNTGIPGVVIVNSYDPNNSSYNITTCTLNAGWGSSTIASSSRGIGRLYSYMSNVPSSWPKEGAIEDSSGYLISSVPNFANLSNFSYPQRRINVSKDWMNFLNPTVVLPDNSTGKYISLLLSSLQVQPTEMVVAQVLNFVLAVALADTGTGYDWGVFPDQKNATGTCDNCLVLEVKYSLRGWLYSAHGTATRLSLTVMLVYCALVLGHILYSAMSGVSSTAWDSTAELVALAMNSSPTKVLQNTCAGIVGRQAFSTSVRVLTTNPGHLELVFGDLKDPNSQASKLVMNQKYGKLTSEDGNEAEEPESDFQGSLRKRTVAQSSE